MTDFSSEAIEEKESEENRHRSGGRRRRQGESEGIGETDSGRQVKGVEFKIFMSF